MSTNRVRPRSANSEAAEPSISQVGPEAGSRTIVSQNDEYANSLCRLHRHSRIVPALVIGLSAFAVAYLLGHLAAALIGWRFVVYAGFALGVWFFAACIVAFFIAGAAGHD